MKQKNEEQSYVVLAVLLIGAILITLQSLKNAPIYIEGLITPLQHPITFRSTTYQSLLKKYVQQDLVDYAALKQAPELRDAVDELKHTSPDKIVAEDDQLAFWINAYNLLVLNLISQNYPVRTIRQLGNVYSAKMYLVGGKPYAVQDIYIGQIFPRAKQGHAASIFLISQGAVGYPPLQDHEYDKDNLKSESETAINKYVNDKHHVSYDADLKALKLSPFFQWTQELYEPQWGSPFDMVNSYLVKKANLKDEGLTQTYSLPFDWRLNDLKLAKNK